MDKNAIKKYAIWARRELIARVSQRAALYEITAEGYGDTDAVSVHGRILSLAEKNQRRALIAQIQQKGFEQVMEEIAYTWFNRFSALRFMEVNGYLPTRIRVFTDEENSFKPQIMTEAINLEMDGLDMQKVFAFKDANDDEGLFKYLLITQCNALSSILPGMFQKIADYTELLFPDNLLREGSVVEQMVSMIPEEDWTDQVQIIGWLYQYYNTEPKDQVFANLKKNIKISKENIPAATQLFTPDWIVRYMVENSLGRLWIEGHPNDELKAKWKYYLDEAEQEEEVQKQLAEIRKEYAALKPEDIRCIDPCMGSGHILVYMFDVLVQIYESYGYSAREATSSIVENNIWGLDIDERAAQLAYFSVMMKARQYDQRFFTRGIQPKIFVIRESNNLDLEIVKYFVNDRNEIKQSMDTLVKELFDANEYGSIINITQVDFYSLYARFEEIKNENIQSIYSNQVINSILPLVQMAQTMAQKYHVVVTNPPYMSITNASVQLNSFAKNNYPISKFDMSTIFMEKSIAMCTKVGMMAMINIPVWMSKSSFEKFRCMLLNNHTFVNMLHNGRGIFGSDFGTTTFVIRKAYLEKYAAVFHQLFDEMGAVDSVEQKERWFFERKGLFVSEQRRFKKIASNPIAYYTSDKLLKILDEEKPLEYFAYPRKGLTTGDNDTFVRLWYEVDASKFSMVANGKKWFPMTKGGDFRRWYGNNDYCVNWENNGFDIKNFKDENGKLKSVPRNVQFYFREGISWNDTTATGKIAFRYQPKGYISNASGPCVFADRNLKYLFGLLNSKVSQAFLEILAPNMKFEVGQMSLVPIIMHPTQEIDEVVDLLVQTAKEDWDSFETSWDFKEHPFISYVHKNQKHNESILIEQAFRDFVEITNVRFNKQKKYEERLNQLFINIYGLNDELLPEVEEKDITLRRADLKREIRSLISYAVGCMFGRYSIDKTGISFAGGTFEKSNFTTFIPDDDAIIPVCDDEYFSDDIVGRFVKFIEIVFGYEKLEDNLQFISKALGGNGNSREIIRNYFLNEFFKDHCNTYQVTGSGKRPIYWLFDSGKKNGFKCLIYMHRYQPDTIARIRTDYVHEQQSRYRTAMADLQNRIDNASTTSERVKLTKKLKTIREQDEELRIYEEKIHHLADQMIKIDLDDGVKVNYAKFQDVLAKIK